MTSVKSLMKLALGHIIQCFVPKVAWPRTALMGAYFCTLFELISAWFSTVAKQSSLANFLPPEIICSHTTSNNLVVWPIPFFRKHDLFLFQFKNWSVHLRTLYLSVFFVNSIKKIITCMLSMSCHCGNENETIFKPVVFHGVNWFLSLMINIHVQYS